MCQSFKVLSITIVLSNLLLFFHSFQTPYAPHYIPNIKRAKNFQYQEFFKVFFQDSLIVSVHN